MKTKILANSTFGRTLQAAALSLVLIALGPGVVRVEAVPSPAVGPIDRCADAPALDLAWFEAISSRGAAAGCDAHAASLVAAVRPVADAAPAKRHMPSLKIPGATQQFPATTAAVLAAAVPAAAKPVRPLAPLSVGPLRDKSLCQASTLNVVAHEDDDLLFMNPDVAKDVAGGRCVRTAYLTAGDAGQASTYWQGREAGAKAAYAAMAGQPNEWLDGREQLEGQFVAVSYLKGRPNVSLIFLRLPDGNLGGAGFEASGGQSLAQLIGGTISEIRSVDDGTTYTLGQVQGMVSRLALIDNPDDIRTLNADDHNDGDHSDHHAAGQLVRMSLADLAAPAQVTHYIGYPIAAMTVNVVDADLAAKQQAFLQYGVYDNAVCNSMDACMLTAYGSYLGRQYIVRPPVIATAVAP